MYILIVKNNVRISVSQMVYMTTSKCYLTCDHSCLGHRAISKGQICNLLGSIERNIAHKNSFLNHKCAFICTHMYPK